MFQLAPLSTSTAPALPTYDPLKMSICVVSFKVDIGLDGALHKLQWACNLELTPSVQPAVFGPGRVRSG